MFSKLRDPRGQYTLLMAGVACLLLAGFMPLLWLSAALVLAGLGCIAAWWRRRREDRYDLKRLFDEPLPTPDEPFHDTLDPESPGSPYCGWCDEAYPPDTHRCLRCGRSLG